MDEHSRFDGDDDVMRRPRTKLDWLFVVASEALRGTSEDTNARAAQQYAQLQQQDRNNFHGYARSPTEQDDPDRNQERDRDSDEIVGGEVRERRRNGGRDEHNRLEKDRRAQLKVNFSMLKDQVPALRDKKASNQAILKGSQKYIQNLTLKGRKYEQEIQEQARKRAELIAQLKRTKQIFESTHGISADAYLQELGDYDADEQCSDATLSATEGPDNMHDFDDMEVDGTAPEVSASSSSQPQMPPPLAPQSTRGIPHSVIRQAPAVNQRQNPNTTDDRSNQTIVAAVQAAPAAPVTVRKQLHAKLTSTKQAHSAPDGTIVVNNTSGASDGTIQVISMPSMDVSAPSSAINTMLSLSSAPGSTSKSPNSAPTVSPVGNSKIPIPQSRTVVQSLLTNVPPRSLLPGIMAPCTTAGVVVASPIQANSALVTSEATVPHISPSIPMSSLVPSLKDCQVLTAGPYPNMSQNPMVPSVLVAANGTGPWVVPMHHGSSVFVMPSTHRAQNPSVTRNGR